MSAVILANSEGKVGMAKALSALGAGAPPLDVVQAGIEIVESDPSVRTVGFGGAPNALGEMECDASVMCGETLRTGSVGALKGFAHPIAVARAVMERTRHVMLVGTGAARFAEEAGAEKQNMLEAKAKDDYDAWLAQRLPPELKPKWPHIPLLPLLNQDPASTKVLGTTTYLVLTAQGKMAGGVSTSGWAYKYPGRLGDSPAIGAGLYVDERYGGAACTGTGEMTIRAGSARTMVLLMKRGATAEEACREAAEDLRFLKGGEHGPVVLHALRKDGSFFVGAYSLKSPAPAFWCWREGENEARGVAPVSV